MTRAARRPSALSCALAQPCRLDANMSFCHCAAGGAAAHLREADPVSSSGYSRKRNIIRDNEGLAGKTQSFIREKLKMVSLASLDVIGVAKVLKSRSLGWCAGARAPSFTKLRGEPHAAFLNIS